MTSDTVWTEQRSLPSWSSQVSSVFIQVHAHCLILGRLRNHRLHTSSLWGKSDLQWYFL